MQARSALPIDPHLPEAVARLRAGQNLVVVAEPGAGKTTRLPRALLDAGFAQHGEIVVLEPRRLATRMAAARVADELGEPLGGRIGYQVRFEERVSARTRVRFVTEGVLTQRLARDGALAGVSVVVLDELHERSLEADLALAFLRTLQRTRMPELKLVAMSATLDAEPLARFLGCDVLNVPGRSFPVAIEHDAHEAPAGTRGERPLHERVAGSVRTLLRQEPTGDLLVFLPGAAEIRRAQQVLERDVAQLGVQLALLHGDLPARDQDRAVTPGPHRKVILSTNVAESSLTIEGVSIVVDSGLARVASHSPWSGLPQLVTAKVSRASAIQRAGRAGRTGPGRCVRLYTQHDFESRPAFEKPEIMRADLTQACLSIAGSGIALGKDAFLEPPPEPAMAAARGLCELLGAFDPEGKLTALGRRMLKLPVHPRLARIALEAAARGLHEEGALIAALLSERDIAREGRAHFGGQARDVERGPSDVLDRLERFEQSGGTASGARSLDLDPGAVSQVSRVYERLCSIVSREREQDVPRPSESAIDDVLLLSVLSGFGDRVAKRRAPGSTALVLGRGGSLTQAESSVARDPELMVVIDAHERERGREKLAYVVSAIEPEHLLELWPERVIELDEVRFDPTRERVEAITGLSYDGIVLDQRQGLAEPSARTSLLLAQAARERGVLDFEQIEHFERRIAHACRAEPTLQGLPSDARDRAVLAACDGLRTLSELRGVSLLHALIGLTPPATLAALDRVAPESLRLPSGRSLPIHYESDRPPWVASRLQDFFGMQRGPKLGAVPLVMHLLAPNQRPVQVTTDLEGFWQRHYPELRTQLMRRYPKHGWPDDPLSAEPPAPRPARPARPARPRGK